MFVYRLKQEIEVFDEADKVIATPMFAGELQLSIKDLFAWLLE